MEKKMMLTCEYRLCTIYLLIEEYQDEHIKMTALHHLMLKLPSEVQNKIHTLLIDMLRHENYSCKRRVFLNWRKQELHHQHSDKWLYMLLESHDIEQYGFKSANVKNLGVTGTLEVVSFNMKVEIKQNDPHIVHKILKCLSRCIAKVHDHTVADQHKVEILNVCNSKLVSQTIARDRLVYGLMKIINGNLLFSCINSREFFVVFLKRYQYLFCI